MTEHTTHVSEAAIGTISYMPREMLEHQRLTKAVRCRPDGQLCVYVSAMASCCALSAAHCRLSCDTSSLRMHLETV